MSDDVITSARITPREPPNRLRQLALTALDEAISDLGQGEVGGNNVGPYVWSLTGRRTSGPWCAAAVFAWYLRASLRLAIEVPGLRLPLDRTHGARELARRIAASGRMLGPLELPSAGDAALWSRPGGHHIGLVAELEATLDPSSFVCVEGNVGRFPARVDLFPHALGEPRLLGFARPW